VSVRIRLVREDARDALRVFEMLRSFERVLDVHEKHAFD
jgi:hypothetical protein